MACLRRRLVMRALFVLLAVGFAPAVIAVEPPLTLPAPPAAGGEGRVRGWPQFRGPAGSGVAPEIARPPTRIGPNTNVKWKVAIPPGASSPVIARDRLFLTGFQGGQL